MPKKSHKKSRSLGATAKHGAAWSILRGFAAQALALPAAVILARLLTPEEFGIVAAAGFFFRLANRMALLGLNAAIVRMKVVEDAHLMAAFLCSVALGVVNAAVTYLAAPWIASFYGRPETGAILAVSAVNFLITPFGMVNMALINRDMRFKASTFIDLLAEVSNSGTSILLAWNGYGYWSLVYGQIVANICQTLAKVVLGRWRPRFAFSMPAFREVLSFGLGVHAKRLLEYAAQNLDSLTVGRVMGMTGLGLYDKAFNTMDRFRERLTIAPGVSLRIFSMIHEEPARFRAAYRKVQLSVSLIALPFFAGLAIAADAFVVVAFGHRWLPSAPLLQVMCLVGFLKVYLSYASAVVQAVGQVWQEVWRQLLYAILVVVGIVLLSPLGILGAALGVLAATAVMAVLMLGLVGTMTDLTWREQMAPLAAGSIAGVLVAVAVAAADLVLTRIAGREAYWIRFGVDSATGGLAWAAYVLATRRSDVRLLVEETLTDMSPALGRVLPRRAVS